MFTGRLSQSSHPWLADHAVLGIVIVPGTALLEMAAWAGGEVCRPDIEELTLHAPLVLPDATAVRIQVTWTRPTTPPPERSPSTRAPRTRRPITPGPPRHRHPRRRRAGVGHRRGGRVAARAGRGRRHRGHVRPAGRGWLRLLSGVPRIAGGVAV